MSSSEAMSAEFDTVATWMAEAAQALGRDHHVPAGCRGSGGPAAMDWLLERLPLAGGGPLLDVGAGLGGPAGYAHEGRGVTPLLVEPEHGACRSAQSLFGFDCVRGDAAALPLASSSIGAAWCLGVLCTTSDHLGVLCELARVLGPAGRVGLLVYAATEPIAEAPEGNDFPRRDELPRLFASAGLTLIERTALDELPGAPDDWVTRQNAVQERVASAHENDAAWKESVAQEEQIGSLLASGAVIGELTILGRAADTTGGT